MTGTCAVIAAAVLLFGKLDASPIEKMFLYLLCRVVDLSTSTQPAASAITEGEVSMSLISIEARFARKGVISKRTNL